MKLINLVKRFYNENCLAKIFRVGLALMGEPPLVSTYIPNKTNHDECCQHKHMYNCIVDNNY